MKKLFIVLLIWPMGAICVKAYTPSQGDNATTRTASPRVNEAEAYNPKGETGFRHDQLDSLGDWVFVDSGSYQLNALELDTTSSRLEYNGAAWSYYQKTLYRYDNAGNDTSYIFQTWDSADQQWVNTYNQVYTFNSNGKQVQNLFRTWDSTIMQWVNSSRNISNYSANGDDTLSVYQTWDTSGNQWVNVNQNVYTFDNYHDELSNTYQSWNSSDNQWVNVFRYVYAYTVAGLVDTNLYQNWISNAWVSNYELLSFYNGKGLDTADVELIWNTPDSLWVNFQETAYTYDGLGNQLSIATNLWDTTTSSFDIYTSLEIKGYNGANINISQISESWSVTDSAYINISKDTIMYNSDSNKTGSISYTWDTLSNQWILVTQLSFLYDSSHRATYELDEVNYDTSTMQFLASDRYFYYYLDTVEGINGIKNDIHASIFPNPTDKEVNIRFSLEQPAAMLMNIYDLDGRMILSQSQNMNSGNNNITLGATDLASGFYTIQLMNEITHQSSVIKLVKQ